MGCAANSQRLRIGAIPSKRQQCNQRAKLATKVSRNKSASGALPIRLARLVTGRSSPSGRWARLTPKPIITASSTRSSKIPDTLAPSANRSLGHLIEQYRGQERKRRSLHGAQSPQPKPKSPVADPLSVSGPMCSHKDCLGANTNPVPVARVRPSACRRGAKALLPRLPVHMQLHRHWSSPSRRHLRIRTKPSQHSTDASTNGPIST